MQQLEGFRYATALDLKMRYYEITIVTLFGKFRYNCLPLGIFASEYILQAKVDKLLGYIDGVKTYIDDILVLGKDIFEKHIEQLGIIFGIIRASGLKVNTPKCSFGLKEVPYLGYLITRKIIKPYTKKVQGIMDLVRPSTRTEAQALIGMVQYYRYIWTRWSHVLAYVIEACSGPKGTKILWNDAL